MSAAMPAPLSRGRWIPWLFVGLFLLVFAVNGVMIWYALSSWTGLAANEAYDQGLTYNRNLAAAARQAQLGWRPQLTVRTAGDGAESRHVHRLADRPGPVHVRRLHLDPGPSRRAVQRP